MVSVTATFSEPVIVVDNSSDYPRLSIFIVDTERHATYKCCSDNATLLFQYTLVDGAEPIDNSGIRIDANGIDLGDNSTIKDAAGNEATITNNLVPDNRYYKVK